MVEPCTEIYTKDGEFSIICLLNKLWNFHSLPFLTWFSKQIFVNGDNILMFFPIKEMLRGENPILYPLKSRFMIWIHYKNTQIYTPLHESMDPNPDPVGKPGSWSWIL